MHDVTTLCAVLGIPRSTYYKSKKKTISKRAVENSMLKDRIMQLYNNSKRRYGAPKIHKLLAKDGTQISLKRVQRLMRSMDLKSIVVKKYKPYPSNKKVIERKNILNRDFSTTTINQKWVGDITYIHTVKDGWCYLASVMDLHTKKIIGYSFAKTMTTDLIINALNNSVVSQKPSPGLIFHSDLGSQYTSIEFQKVVEKLNITHSFSKKGCPYDNACIESFHAALKKEEVNLVTYYNFDIARIAMFEYIEGWYNHQRIHGSIGYITPNQCEVMARKS